MPIGKIPNQTGGLRPVIDTRKKPGIKPGLTSRLRPTIGQSKKGLEPEVMEVADGLFEKLQKAEANLASIRDSDPNAKWALARLKSQQMFIDTNDTDYYICVCFESRHQKLKFLEAVGLLNPDEDKFFSGPALAKAIGLELTPDKRGYHTLSVNRRWARFAKADSGPGESLTKRTGKANSGAKPKT